MIPNQWYAVLEASEVAGKRPVGVTRMGEKLVFWRDTQGRVICQRDKCAHRGAALSQGEVCGDTIQCPFHGFEYDSSGQCTLIPANSTLAPVPERFQVPSYPAREANGFIYIWWGEPRSSLPPVPFFSDIDQSYNYSVRRDPWATHYSRAIENQLDVMHLPFVHHNTIGRGGRTVVDGPVVRWVNKDLMYVYVYNRQENGSLPLKPTELPEKSDRPFHLEFHFPNLWQNYISPNVRVVVAFAPVDDENTVLYIRFYQNRLRVPVLRQLMTYLAMPFNLLVAHQDRRIVVRQRPKRSDLNIGENLAQGDRPIVEYRRRRRALIQEASEP